MAATEIKVQMQQRRDTAANWTSTNPTLLSGEFGYETDTGKFKVGDGSTVWTSLAYIPGFSISGYPLATADISDDAITAAKLADTGVIAGTYFPASINIDAQGRITAASTTTVGTAGISDDAVTAAKLADTAVTAGSYTAADITVDAQGRITAAASGTVGTAEIADGAITSAKLDTNITISGDLTVNGTTTTINSTTLQVDDKNIELGTVATPTDTTADGGGITLKGTTDHTIIWTDSTDSWDFSEHVNIASGKEFKIAGTSVLSATTLGSGVTGSSLTSVGTITTGVWQGTAIATASIADDAVTAAKLADTAVTAGSYTAADITVDAQGRITAAASGTISTAEIADDAVTAAKLADTAVTAGSYTAADITVDAQGRITSAASGTIATAEIADDAVTSAKIADGTIVDANVGASAAIAGTKIDADFGDQDLTVDTDRLFVDVSENRVGINCTPAVTLDINATDAVALPHGTNAQRPSDGGTPANLTGYIRFNSDITQFEGHNGTSWAAVGGGATGGGSDAWVVETDQTVTTSYELSSGKHGTTVSPTINSNATITVPSGAILVIL